MGFTGNVSRCPSALFTWTTAVTVIVSVRAAGSSRRWTDRTTFRCWSLTPRSASSKVFWSKVKMPTRSPGWYADGGPFFRHRGQMTEVLEPDQGHGVVAQCHAGVDACWRAFDRGDEWSNAGSSTSLDSMDQASRKSDPATRPSTMLFIGAAVSRGRCFMRSDVTLMGLNGRVREPLDRGDPLERRVRRGCAAASAV